MRETIIKKFWLIFSAILMFSYAGFAGINIAGTISDLQTTEGISDATVSLVGTNISTQSLADGSFILQDVPRFSSGFQIKVSKSGYVTTYTLLGNIEDTDISDISFPMFSISVYNMMPSVGGVPHTPGKGDITGMVNLEGSDHSGVRITAKYMDTNQSAGTIRYIGENNYPSSSLTSTSSNGMFVIYNVDASRPIVITGEKSGVILSGCSVIGYPDSITVASIETVQSKIPISGIVCDNDDTGVSGVNISILGTGISTTSKTTGLFNLDVPPISYGIMKLSKTGYIDTYQSGNIEEHDSDDGPEEFSIVSQTFYNQLLSLLGKTHISGRGDILGEVETPNGFVMADVTVKVYDKDGTLLHPDIFYSDEEETPSTEPTATTSASEFVILNLNPGYYHIVCAKDGFEFGRCLAVVFKNGFTFAPTIISYPPIPGFMKAKGQDIPSANVPVSAQRVPMLAFCLNMMDEVDEHIILDRVVATSKGTGNISTSLSSAKLYLDSDNNGSFEKEISTGAISGNKIIFSNINTEVGMGLNQRYMIVFNFNGQATLGQTFGVDILKNADISAHAKNSGLPVSCDGEEPLLGNLMTMVKANPPLKPRNISPANNATGINPFSYTLQASQFEPGNGNSQHKASDWILWKDGESNETFTCYQEEQTYWLTWILSPSSLEGLTKYWWQVRYENGENLCSEWSEPTCFTTAADGILPPLKPSNTYPVNGATDVSLPVTLTGSVFTPGTEQTHCASHWQVSTNQEMTQPVYDSKRDTQNLTSTQISRLSYNTTYYWRVRYQDGYGAWSPWSTPTYFTTKLGRRGDLNHDTEIDISDVILCLRMAINLDQVDVSLADMNNDSMVDISDVILILRRAIGLDEE